MDIVGCGCCSSKIFVDIYRVLVGVAILVDVGYCSTWIVVSLDTGKHGYWRM